MGKILLQHGIWIPELRPKKLPTRMSLLIEFGDQKALTGLDPQATPQKWQRDEMSGVSTHVWGTSYQITLFHVISNCVIPYHIVSFQIILYHFMTWHISSFHFMSFRFISKRLILYLITSYHFMSHHYHFMFTQFHTISYCIRSYHSISFYVKS
jgi:hypothetical protein